MPKPPRRYDIDWLRTLAVLFLVLFHVIQVFDPFETARIKNVDKVPLAGYVVKSAWVWFMPLFFFVSGFSTKFALDFRSFGRYAKERLKRLGIPLLFGLLLFILPATHYSNIHLNGYSGSFLNSFKLFLNVETTSLGLGYNLFKISSGIYDGQFSPGHLWFIFYLLIMSLLSIPFFKYLRREKGQLQIKTLASLNSKLVLLWPVVPLILAQLLPDLVGRNPVYFLVFFILGYIFALDKRFEEALIKHKLLVGLLGPGLLLLAMIPIIYGIPLVGGLLWLYRYFIFTFVAWFCVLFILWLGKRFLNTSSPALRFLGPASYPIYLIHYPFQVIASFYIVQLNWGILAKFLTILALTFSGTILTYLIAKQIRPLHTIFGIKTPRPRTVK